MPASFHSAPLQQTQSIDLWPSTLYTQIFCRKYATATWSHTLRWVREYGEASTELRFYLMSISK